MFFYLPKNDLIQQGSGIVASSNNAYFPVSLLYQSHLACDVWRSVTGNASETLTIDLGGSYKVSDYPNGLDLLVDSWNANDVCSSVTVTLTGPGGTTALVLNGDSSTPQRYTITLDPTTGTTAVVITFNKASSTTYVQVGKLFLGSYFDSGASGGPETDKGYDRQFGELSNVDKSVLGQQFGEMRAVFWKASITMTTVPESAEATLRASAFEALGTFTPFWLIVKVGLTDGELDLPRYCRQNAIPSEKLVGYGAASYWAVNISVEKQL